MDSYKIRAVAIFIIATVIAIWLGLNAATAQLGTIMWVAGVSGLVICGLLGTKIWMLLIFSVALKLSLPLPGNPDTELLGQFLFIGFGTALFLLRKLPHQPRFGELELWGLLLIICVLQVYLRNPVGMNMFGSATVGAKPYAVVGLSAMCAVLLCGYFVKAESLHWIIRLSLIGWILNLILHVLGNLMPSIGVYYGAGGIMASATQDSHLRAGRIAFLGRAGESLAIFAAAYISPIKAVLKPKWAVLILITLLFATFSGFRNDIVAVGFIYILALFYHGGMHHFLAALTLLVIGLSLLAVINLAAPLPPNVQRSLSFLPGTWEADIRRDAKSSTEWRYEIWREVMVTDRWIKNKWVGDGLGFSKQELKLQQHLEEMRRSGVVTHSGKSGFDMHRESILANGDYHSGPIHTIRTIGYVGLIILMVAIIRLAMHAHQLIRRCKNTEYYPIALLIGIPLITSPFFFVFVNGQFQSISIIFFMGMGMVRLIGNSLPRDMKSPPVA